MDSSRLIAILALLWCSALADEAVEQLLSKAPERDAKVIGRAPKDGAAPGLKLVSDGDVIWTHGLSWGYPASSVVSWSPHSSKVAISVRTTKTTSEIHVFDVWKAKKEIKIPDLGDVASALVSQFKGRSLHVSPVGWSGEDDLLVKVSGNLIDSLTGGNDELNFNYIITVNLPTGRILSAVCTSKHNLNSEHMSTLQPAGRK